MNCFFALMSCCSCNTSNKRVSVYCRYFVPLHTRRSRLVLDPLQQVLCRLEYLRRRDVSTSLLGRLCVRDVGKSCPVSCSPCSGCRCLNNRLPPTYLLKISSCESASSVARRSLASGEEMRGSHVVVVTELPDQGAHRGDLRVCGRGGAGWQRVIRWWSWRVALQPRRSSRVGIAMVFKVLRVRQNLGDVPASVVVGVDRVVNICRPPDAAR